MTYGVTTLFTASKASPLAAGTWRTHRTKTLHYTNVPLNEARTKRLLIDRQCQLDGVRREYSPHGHPPGEARSKRIAASGSTRCSELAWFEMDRVDHCIDV